MMKTASDFSQQVRKCEKAIRAAHAANGDVLTATKAVMTLPLPLTYEHSNDGAGSAVAVMHVVGGPNFKAETVSRVGNEAGHKLETEVLAPLQRWQDVHLQLAVSARGGPGCPNGGCTLSAPLYTSCHIRTATATHLTSLQPPHPTTHTHTRPHPPAHTRTGTLQGAREHTARAGVAAAHSGRSVVQVGLWGEVGGLPWGA